MMVRVGGRARFHGGIGRVAVAALVVMALLPIASSRAATTITVNTASDSDGDCTVDECSLREAIQLANSLAGKDTIVFDIPGDPPPAIQAAASFPPIYDPVVIDGTTQPGYQGTPIVEIDGSQLNEPGVYGDGLTLWANDSLIRGLVINGFQGGYGISVRGEIVITPGVTGGDNNVIQHNYIGTTRDGRQAKGNYMGIALSVTNGTLVGGTSPGQANVISGNYHGVYVGPGDGTGTRVLGNMIGTDPSGSLAVGNTGEGVILNGSGYTFGGPGAGEGNVVSGNSGDGFEVTTESAFGNVIQGNRIGAAANGAALGNTDGPGLVFVFDAHDNLVGGMGPGEGNVIAHNSSGGIVAYNGLRNRFVGNSIHSNNGLGIDLLVSSRSGVTPNDASDADQGANNLQNYPRIQDASLFMGFIYVTAVMTSTPNSTFEVDVFDNAACDSSGNGEGRYYLGTTEVTTGDEGVGSVTARFPAPVLPTHVITTTARDSAGNTSEFSRCLVATNGGPPAPSSSPTPGSTPTSSSSPTPGSSPTTGSSPSPGASTTSSPSPEATTSPGGTPAPGTADVSVTHSIHYARRYYSEPGPLLEGNPEIPDRLWFIYQFRNEGPAATDIVFRVHHDTFDYTSPGGPRYDFWTAPMDVQSTYESGGGNCNFDTYVCRVRLRANRSYMYIIDAEANAPAPFSVYATAYGEAPDPDRSNNRSEIFDGRVVCKINGTPGADHLVATPEPDSICGGAGNDRLTAVGKRDKIFGQGGNDILSGRGSRNQGFFGGDGFDIATFKNEPRDVVVALHARTAGGRTAYDVEGAIGSRFADYMTGLLGRDKLWGGPGNDRMAGRSGRDGTWGGPGDDRFITVDGVVDSVSGGPGNDLTQSDGNDRVRSATRTSSPTFYLDPV